MVFRSYGIFTHFSWWPRGGCKKTKMSISDTMFRKVTAVGITGVTGQQSGRYLLNESPDI
jgi:hypothetical protein